MDCLLEQEVLNGIGSSFPDFIEALSYPAHLKDAQTGKYIVSNSFNILLGDKLPQEIVGLTAADLLEIFYAKPNFCSPTFSGRKNEDLKLMHRLENDARTTKRLAKEKRIYFSSEGFVCLEEALKIPILNHDHRKTVAIFTCSHDLTLQQYSLIGLFQLYRQFYPERRAIELFLRYLKVEHFFAHLPTVREMQTLLAMNQHPSRKRIARLLNISSNTVASHLQHLKEFKLAKPDLEAVILQLRKLSMKIEENA